ncbi:hypothetical protein QTP88_028202 [Uroleucon formosanum]
MKPPTPIYVLSAQGLPVLPHFNASAAVLIIQEIRLSGPGSTEIGNSIIFFGQYDNRRQGGTGFIVKKNIASAIKDFKVVNSRLTILIVEGKFFNIALVNAHAPSEDKSDEEKEEFYSLLESTLEEIPRHCIIILLGDFNAKIGKEECFKTTTGSNSLHQLSNNNGFRLIELATGRGLKIKSTSFPHKEIHKGTWRSPDGRYINQIDHVLVNARFSNSVLDVRTFHGAECGSDHFLVVGKLKVRLKKAKKRKEEQTELFDIQKLCDLKICEDFCKNISNEFNNEHIDNKNDDIESLWSAIRNICENALQRRKQAREVWLKDIQNEEKFSRYKTRLKEATKIIRCEKRKFIKDINQPWAEEIIGDYQASFRQNRSTIDQIFILRQVLHKTWEYDKSVHMVFIDYKKAYDSIHRVSLMKTLEEFGMPMTTGLRQGDAISPVLFNIVLEKVVREAALDKEGVKLGKNNIGILAYADDIVLMAESKDKLKEESKQLINAAKRVGLEINAEKTEYMVVQRHEQIGCRNEVLEVENYKFKRVQQFKYLGTLITQPNEIGTKIKARIQAANKCYFDLTKLLKSRVISKNLKSQIYQTLIKPVVTYGSETWSMRKKDENALLVFERKVLRKIYGPCIDEPTGEWRIRKNKELQDLYQRPSIKEDITKRRLKWAGHSWKKTGSFIKIVQENAPKGKRPLGRPRLRWEDRIKEDIEKVRPGLDWKELALDRETWRQICWMTWS